MRLLQFLLLAVIHGGCVLLAVDSDHPVEIATAGSYDIDINIDVSTAGNEPTIDLLTVILDGSVVATRRNLSNLRMTGDDNGERGPHTYRFEKVPFTAGPHTITVHTENVDDSDPTQEQPARVAELTVTPAVTEQAPFGGVLHRIPGRIEAEDYDVGGAGLAYDRISWEPLNQTYRHDDIGIYTNRDIQEGTNTVLVHLDNALQHPALYDQWEELPEQFAPAWVEYTVTCDVTGNLHVGIGGQVRDFFKNTVTQRVQLAVDGVTIPDIVTFHFTYLNETTGGIFRNVPFTRGTHRLRFTLLPPPAGSSASDPNFTTYGVNFDAIGVSVPAPPPVDLVMENDDPGVTLQGHWFPATIAPGYHGPDYLYAIGLPQRDERAIYRPTLPSTGKYEVSIWYPSRSVRSPAVPVTVTTYNQSQQVVVNQRINGGQWVVLGNWTLLAGNSTSVTIETGRVSGITVADAVRFRKVEEATVFPANAGDVVVDDSDSQRVSFTGTWLPSRRVNNYLGIGYHYADPGSPAPTTATYTPYLPMTGLYEVIIGFPAYGARSPSTPVTVQHRDGSKTITIDQRHVSEQVLGRWMFSAGTQGKVIIDGAAARGYVIADHVRFRLISAPFNGQPLAVPGTFLGAEFDRTTNQVKVWERNGKWAQSTIETLYSIQVPIAGTYDIAADYSKLDESEEEPRNPTINEMAILVDGTRVFERLYAPNAGGLRAEKVHLAAGLHLITIYSREGGGSLPIFRDTLIKSVAVSLSPTTQTPFHGVPTPIPGLIEAEDYDRGGLGLAYNRTSWFIFPSYRSDDIGIVTFRPFMAPTVRYLDLDTPTVNPFAYTEQPDPIIGILPQRFEAMWVEYTISSATADAYDLVIQAFWGDQRVQIAIDGTPVTGAVGIPGTGNVLADATIPDVAIPAGVHRLRLTLLPPPDGQSSPFSFRINSLEIVPAPSPLSKG